MLRVDTLDKIIGTYLSHITRTEFSYNGKNYVPSPLRVSPGLFRGFTCPAGCGGCCFKFSLDYLPTELYPYPLETRFVTINGKEYPIKTDWQEDNEGTRCKHLRKDDGRCNIHGKHPFSCDFELIGFHTFQERSNQLNQRLFGRGWSYKRTDGGVGSKCELTPVSPATISEVIRKLERLKEWADYFELDTHIDTILAWAAEAPHIRPLYLNQEQLADDGPSLW